jgi:transcriptional regulatory protein RtcR
MAKRRTVVFGFPGSVRDGGANKRRWDRWRPTVSLGQQDDFEPDLVVLFYKDEDAQLTAILTEDLKQVSPRTEVVRRPIALKDPWDFAEVYAVLYDAVRDYPFVPAREDYFVHITTGTHVIQIVLFLLVESRHIPGKLLQSSPTDATGKGTVEGRLSVIDLDLQRYDALATRFKREREVGLSLLKGGVATRNAAFNKMMTDLERVALKTRDPILLTGPTGSGKTELASRIYTLKHARHDVTGPLVEINCATIRGDQAMSTLFGHVRGAFTGAIAPRPGLLREANDGLLFLDEVGELGLEEQAMLLRALEEGSFYPVGSDRAVTSRFLLICGTHRNLAADVAAGRFREDLLARIELWTFALPALKDRPEDLEPNLDLEIERASERYGTRVAMSREARQRFLELAKKAPWPGNFRELSGVVRRMAALSDEGRITPSLVEQEMRRLGERPGSPVAQALASNRSGLASKVDRVREVLGDVDLDLFDRAQLEAVLEVCLTSKSLSEAGRTLFAASRQQKASSNDADRLRKYLARFGLTFADSRPAPHAP